MPDKRRSKDKDFELKYATTAPTMVFAILAAVMFFGPAVAQVWQWLGPLLGWAP